MDRIVKQARSAINEYIRNKCDNKPYHTLDDLDFAKFIADSNDLKLNVKFGSGMPALRGLILLSKKEKNATVLLSNDNNNCWKRFTLIKEICHLFLEHEHNIDNDDALKMAESLMLHVAFLPNFLPTCHTDIKDEYKNFEDVLNPLGAEETSAVVAAIEILIPVDTKAWIADWIEEGCHLNDISLKLKVPNLILEHRLKEWCLPVPSLK